MTAFRGGIAMDFLLNLDLDGLCLAAELAAGLLLLSLAWRPPRATSPATEPSVTTIDWGPVQNAFVHAVTSLGRCLSIRSNSLDEERLRDMQHELPPPYRDRLTGIWNSQGMDRLHEVWCAETNLHEYPSSYVALTITDQETLMEQHGAVCVEHALRKISELSLGAFAGQASVSRYQPHRFLLHFYGMNVANCHVCVNAILEQINAPEFLSYHDEFIAIQCEARYWFCNRSIEVEQLLQILDDGGDSVTGEKPIAPRVAESSSVDQESVAEPEPVSEKPFSIDSLAPFPSPWDDPPEEPAPAPPVLDSASTSPPAEGILQPAASSNAPVESSTSGESANAMATTATTESSESVEGFASPEDIAMLLAQLQPGGGAARAPAVSKPPVPVEPPGEATATPPTQGDDTTSPNCDVQTADAAPIEMPMPVSETPKTRSIYSDDIEDMTLKSDLASLFATVRSSAAGDFGYGTAAATVTAPKMADPEP